ncbi:MAG: amidohydrolase family protein [Verrucomicrobia bacterium]|nr:amidohydrolase family protein [Verrucomicrobiota bacterium]
MSPLRLCLLACLSLGLAPAGSSAAERLLLENVRVIDVARGQAGPSVSVAVVDGRLASIGADTAVSEGARRVDGRGAFLLPGLIDLHVHLFNHSTRRPPNEWTFPLFVAHGVTGVREMRTQAEGLPFVRRWEEQRAAGRLLAPRILATGGAVVASTPEEARELVRKTRAAGLDFLKLFSPHPESVWRALMAEARRVGLPVAGHTPQSVSALESAQLGQRSNEHLTQIYEACTAAHEALLAARRELDSARATALTARQEADILRAFDPALAAPLAVALARTGQVQVPTLVLPHAEAHAFARDPRADPRWPLLRADEQARWERLLREPLSGGPELAARRWEVSRRLVGLLHAGGVRILAGTDTPMPTIYPGYSLHDELERLVEAGLSPADALRAATLWAADFLGRGDLGRLEPGARADLVLLASDPLTDIRHTRSILAVCLEGRWLERAELDALLRPTKAAEAGR